MFKILVHRTNGQYTRSRENMAELEAASIIEASSQASRLSLYQSHPVNMYVSLPAAKLELNVLQTALEMSTNTWRFLCCRAEQDGFCKQL